MDCRSGDFSGPYGALSALVSYSCTDSDDESMSKDEDCCEKPFFPIDSRSLVTQLVDELICRVFPDITVTPQYRDQDSSDESENEESSGDEDSEDSDSSSSSDRGSRTKDKRLLDNNRVQARYRNRGMMVKGELRSCDLPPIEDLHISVPYYECVPLGIVQSAVEDLVVVKSLPNTPAINLDSVLFLERGKRPLGKVFDVIGPIKSPFYCVRFNSAQHICDSDIIPGMEVFCAPRTEHTSYIFLDQLKKLKGSDASWKDDVEPPVECRDYSDDEEERNARRARKDKNAKEKDTAEKKLSGGECSKLKRVYNPPNHTLQAKNAFYRKARRYVPGDFGPIRWNSVHTAHKRYPSSADSRRSCLPPPMPNFNQPVHRPSASSYQPPHYHFSPNVAHLASTSQGFSQSPQQRLSNVYSIPSQPHGPSSVQSEQHHLYNTSFEANPDVSEDLKPPGT